jgi:UDP-N-acetylglucosamine transferase subunit ALG13
VIFVTVGSMFPFDRLIRRMDEWAASAGRSDVFAQIGDGRYEPAHMRFVRRLSQAEFGTTVAEAELIVAHAGMGTVITAGRAGRPMVLLPRIEAQGEHTTDHQIATANWLRTKPGIHVADTDADLSSAIAAGLTADPGTARFSPVAEAAFTDRIRAAILNFAPGRG